MRIWVLAVIAGVLAAPGYAQTPTAAPASPQIEEVNLVAAPPKPFKINGGLEVQPICFDDQDYCIGLIPSLSLSTEAEVAENKSLNIGLAWQLIYRGFVTSDNHEENEMKFWNIFGIDTSLDIAEKLDFAMYSGFEFVYFKEDDSNNEFWAEANPQFGYKVLPTTRAYMGYRFIFDRYANQILQPGEIDQGPSSDGDDLGERIFTSSDPAASNTPSFDPFLSPFLGAAIVPGDPTNTVALNHGLNVGVSHSFSDSVSGLLDYTYSRWYSNSDGAENLENRLKTRLGKDWTPEFNTTLEWRVRVRDFVFTPNTAGSAGKRDIRNRIYFKTAYKISKAFSLNGYYRIQLLNQNAGASSTVHQGWLGGKVSF